MSEKVNQPVVFDGRQFAAQKRVLVHKQVVDWKATHLVPLTLYSIYPQEDPASILYTKLKKEDAQEVGMVYQTQPLSLKKGRHAWLRSVMEANHNDQVHAVLVQKPTRHQYQKYSTSRLDFTSWWQNVAEAIDLSKDVDGLAPLTLFKLEKKSELVVSRQQQPLNSLHNYLLPATAQAVIDIALHAVGGVEALRSKKVAVIGRSVIVGRPAAAGLRLLGVECQLLSSKHDLSQELPVADVVISATGKAGLVQESWLKPQVVLIDVGSPQPEFSEDCYAQASFYTPVPYGVGPVTRACLLENVFKLPSLSKHTRVR